MKRPRFSEKVALVTGGGSGLGRAFCQAFAEEGASVMCADINMDAARETASLIEKAGGEAMAFETDVSDSTAVTDMVGDILDRCGQIDVLVNNAGVGLRQSLVETTEEAFDRVIGVNLKGPFLLAKAVAPNMIERKQGRIVNVASTAGVVGQFSTAYTASKAGLIGMTRLWALELAPYKVRVNSVALALIATPHNEALRKSPAAAMIADQTPLGIGAVEDVVPMVLFLSSDESGYITGECVNVDGGLVACRGLGSEVKKYFEQSGAVD
jgi:3-oxoacyl-[acyl-carrier protein] reductase